MSASSAEESHENEVFQYVDLEQIEKGLLVIYFSLIFLKFFEVYSVPQTYAESSFSHMW